jgi:hypothetical protein
MEYKVHTFYAGVTGYVVYVDGVEVYYGHSSDEIVERFGIHPDDMEEV